MSEQLSKGAQRMTAQYREGNIANGVEKALKDAGLRVQRSSSKYYVPINWMTIEDEEGYSYRLTIEARG